MTTDKLPTNKGIKSIGEVIDYLTYTSYATQRDNGMAVENCKTLYSNVDAMEQEYQIELLTFKN